MGWFSLVQGTVSYNEGIFVNCETLTGQVVSEIKSTAMVDYYIELAVFPSCLQVLWRYSGEAPATLGVNTRIYNWIPQNDLLGKWALYKSY